MSADLNPTAEQRQILDAAAAMLGVRYPVSRRREPEPDDLTAIVELGLIALALPEAEGGAGLTLVEEALVHVLLGRHLVSPRALAGPIAARLAGELGRDGLVHDLASGALEACPALRAAGGLTLVDAGPAGLAVVFESDRLALVGLGEADRDGWPALGGDVALTRMRGQDVEVLGEGGSGQLLAATDLLVSAQLLGVAEGARDLAVDYARIRQQFGRPIGNFQAIKHTCADMALRAEMLSAQLDMAAIAARDAREDAAFQVAAVRRLAPRAALDNARACIQVHGGIGFSAEAEPHLFLKHAHVLRQLGGFADIMRAAAPLAPDAPMARGG